MSDPYLSEIRIFGFNFAPRSWALCDGQILPINQNQSLYSLLGTTYGGDGRTTFALPDLRGRTPLHRGSGFTQGAKSGEEGHPLTVAEIPQHKHTAQASSAVGASSFAANQVLAATAGGRRAVIPYADNTAATATALKSDSISSQGSAAGHNNMQPYQALNFAIALQGVFPSRN